jgi:hypothetical protein
MSEALILTGKRGQGKTLYAIERIRRYMMSGRMIATNINLNVDKLVGPSNKVRPYRLPDHPQIGDFEVLPLGNPDPVNEKMNGLLVLDEASTFLNSREWQDSGKKERLKIIGWLAQSRKKGWDLIVIVQHVNMLDSQIREGLFEHFGVCVNLEGMLIPFVSRLSHGYIRFPKIHRVAIRIGFNPRAPLVEHDFFKGADLYAGYDTLQVINPLIGVPSGGGYCLLSAYDLRGRYMSWWQRMRKILIAISAFSFFAGAGSVHAWRFFKPVDVPLVVDSVVVRDRVYRDDIFVYGEYSVSGVTHVRLRGARPDAVALSIMRFSDGRREYEIEPGVWVRSGQSVKSSGGEKK